MNRLCLHAARTALLIGSTLALLAGCAVTDGNAYRTDLRIGLDYYDPWFDDYGGWPQGYRVGPPRRPIPRPDGDRDGGPPRGYRPPPPSRQIPTLPSRQHPGRPKPGP